MADIGPIENSYIDGIIKSNVTSNPDATKTQGADLRVLIKLLRDRLEQEIANNTGSDFYKGEWVLPTDDNTEFTYTLPLILI